MTDLAIIRAARPDDYPSIRVVVQDAFADEGGVVADLVDLLRDHPCGRDGLVCVADVAGTVVGVVMVTRSRLDALEQLIDVAVLSPLAVAGDWQGRGLGRRLVEQACSAAREAGFPLLFLEGDPALYVRLGFVAAKPLGFRKPSIRVPDEAFQVMVLPCHEPWMTGTLVYAEPFWDLDAVGLRDPEFIAWVRAEVADGRQL